MSEQEKDKVPLSSSHDRLVKGYLRPALAPKFEKYVEQHGISMSEAINDAVKLLVDGPASTSKK